MTDQWKEVEEILKKYVAVNPENVDTKRWMFIGDMTPLIDDLMTLFYSELEKVRQETEKRHQREMEELRRKTLDEVLEVIKGEKTGHSSYSCQKKEGGICICGANEDRWNLALDQISQSINNIKK